MINGALAMQKIASTVNEAGPELQKLKKATRRRKEHGRVLHPVTGDQDQLGANAILKKFNYNFLI